MRLLVSPVASNPRSRAPVRLYLAFAALALVGWAVQRVRAGGLSPAEVDAYYLGGGAEPLAPAAIWEEIHMGAFVHGFTLFMLGALLAVSPVPSRLRTGLFVAAVAAAFADLFAPFGVLALHGGGLLRVATFVASAATSGALLALVAARFGREARDA
ncbi:MAG: hypothetical protein QM704_18225 [Anaeromyxobacteraceae bacterium]